MLTRALRIGYVRSPDGTFTLFDISGGGTGPFQAPNVQHHRRGGHRSCRYAGRLNHGFLRATMRDHEVDAPGAVQAVVKAPPCLNNPSNAISEFVIAGAASLTAFLRNPLGRPAFLSPGFGRFCDRLSRACYGTALPFLARLWERADYHMRLHDSPPT